MSTKILIPAIFTTYRPKSDNSFSITFNTQEFTPEQLLLINQLRNKAVYLMIKESEIEGVEEELLDNVEADLSDFGANKSLSQRLRNVMFVEWKQNPMGFADFKAFYKYKMERAIESVKNKLDPR